MRIAETTRTRTLVALATVGTLALASVIVATERPRAPEPTRARAGTPITPMRGCGKKPTPPVANQAPAPSAVQPRSVHPHGTTATYREVLMSASDQLQACVTRGNVGYRLALAISPAGQVSSVEVKADAQNLADVDLKVVKCLETVVSPLAFPRAPHDVRMSTYIHAR